MQTLADPMDIGRAQALAATLGDMTPIEVGDPLPPFAHHIYFWDAQPPNALGRDGHPAKGSFIPDLGLPRRMWAAGKLVWHRDRKSIRLNSSHRSLSRMPSSA